jgi:hypothetical protein
MPFLARHREALIAAGVIVFLSWFVMKLHMDTSNDSETEAYVGSLIANAASGTISADDTGHYAVLAPYLMWPIAQLLQTLTGAYLIRGLVFAIVLLALAILTAAYVWYRTLSLGWFTSLVGLVLLSTSTAFAMQTRGWELDKLMEPVLFVLAGMAVWQRRWLIYLLVAVLAVANRDTGVLIVLIPLALAGAGWPFWASLVLCTVEMVFLRVVGPQLTIPPWAVLYELVNSVGGLCLLPLLALLLGRTAERPIRRLLFWLTPAWFIFVVATDTFAQGAVLLAPAALVWLPVTLLAIEQAVRLGAPGPAAPAAQRSRSVVSDT